MDCLDRYVVVKEIGSGSFGTVYHCQDPFLSFKDVAVKVIETSADKAKAGIYDDLVNGLREGAIFDLCRHKYVVEVYNVLQSNINDMPSILIMMEYIDGSSVETLIKNEFVSVRRSLEIMEHVLFGLEHIHTKGFLHRDVKPANILLNKDGSAKLSDFGLASNQHDSTNLIGYIPHMPIEFWTNDTINIQTDIYASGITLFRLLFNLKELNMMIDKCSSSEEHNQFIVKILSKGKWPEIPQISHVPNRVLRVLRKAINPDTAKRFRSADAFRTALEKFKYNIDWVQEGDCRWEGLDQDNKVFEAELISTLSEHKVQVKKGYRKITEACRTFKDLNEGKSYLLEYVQESSLR